MNKKSRLLKGAAIIAGVLSLSLSAPILQQEAQAAYGWKYQYGNWYYYDNNQQMAWSTWIYDGGAWYYLDQTGAMYYSGWLKERGTWYFMTGSGAMATGWHRLDGSWYYFQPSGAMQTGWLNDRGTWYYLDTGSGAMYANAYTPDGFYVDSTGAWVQHSSKSKQNTDPKDYEPSWYNWTTSGYDEQDIDLKYLRAGKWKSSDGDTVLYIDYPSSPDGFSFGMYYDGEIWESRDGAEVDWKTTKSDGSTYIAHHYGYGFRFKGIEPGVMDVTKDGDTVRLYLKKAKYDDSRSGSQETESQKKENQESGSLAYDKGYMADLTEYAYAYRPWLSVDRDGTFDFSENFDGEMLMNSGTYSVSGDTLTLKVTYMDYGNENDMGNPVVKFKILSNGNLKLTYTETGITPTGTLFYVDTRE